MARLLVLRFLRAAGDRRQSRAVPDRGAGELHELCHRSQHRRHRILGRRGSPAHLFVFRPRGHRCREDLLSHRAHLLDRQPRGARIGDGVPPGGVEPDSPDFSRHGSRHRDRRSRGVCPPTSRGCGASRVRSAATVGTSGCRADFRPSSRSASGSPISPFPRSPCTAWCRRFRGDDFITVAIACVSATLLGFASHAPGSLGVFDAAMLVALPDVEQGGIGRRAHHLPRALFHDPLRHRPAHHGVLGGDVVPRRHAGRRARRSRSKAPPCANTGIASSERRSRRLTGTVIAEITECWAGQWSTKWSTWTGGSVSGAPIACAVVAASSSRFAIVNARRLPDGMAPSMTLRPPPNTCGRVIA